MKKHYKELYEQIISDVAKIVKKHLIESEEVNNLPDFYKDENGDNFIYVYLTRRSKGKIYGKTLNECFDKLYILESILTDQEYILKGNLKTQSSTINKKALINKVLFINPILNEHYQKHYQKNIFNNPSKHQILNNIIKTIEKFFPFRNRDINYVILMNAIDNKYKEKINSFTNI